MKKEQTIDPSKVYDFPSEISEIAYQDKWIIVSGLTANWIVLENEAQLEFFHLLQSYSLGDALSRFNGPEADAQWVVIQLEARKFESKQTNKKHTELSVHFYLTNGCNMRCPHCYMFAGNKAENELTTEEISCAIKDLAKGGINSIVFSGGEPLMNADFELFVKLACSLGMEVQVLSNGSLWTDELIDRLSPYLASVQISIDGYDEESNSRIRGKGNLSKALHTVETLLSKGVKTSVAMVPEWSDKLAENAEKYVTFAKGLMEKYDGKPFSFNVVGDVWEGRDYRLNSKEKKQLSEIASYILTNTMGVNSEDEPFIEYHRRFGIEDNCAYGNLSISANGDVYLCAQIQPLNPIGNIRTSSISSLLSISERAKKQSEISNLAPCSDCAIRYICGGGCRIKFFSFFNKGILLSDGQHPRRECTDKDKQFMYDLMIRTNEFIFQ